MPAPTGVLVLTADERAWSFGRPLDALERAGDDTSFDLDAACDAAVADEARKEAVKAASVERRRVRDAKFNEFRRARRAKGAGK